MSDSNYVWESAGGGTRDELEDRETTGLTEHELLDIMYNTCNTSDTGEVLSSTILQYLQTMTAQSSGQDRLSALQRLLDPDLQDPHVSRETFHSTMREWIAQCSQDSSDVDSSNVSWPGSSRVSVNGLDFSASQSKAAFSESHQCSCDGKDLLGTVSELKHAHRKLNEQNSSLLRTMAQCEDVNLQLTLEVTELQAKLASAQGSAVRARALTEEVEETRRALKEAQERNSRTQSSCNQLSNEVDCLKVHIRRLEDKNEKLTFERKYSEDNVNKLRKANAELRGELEETLLMLTLRDKEIMKKEILMNKMKNSHVENHSMIECLQSELVRLQEHSHQVLLRYERHFISSQSLYSRDLPNHRSLQTEIQDIQQQQNQQRHRDLEDINLHSDDIQSIIHRIKSAEIAHLLHNKYPERDSAPVETLERPFPLHQQPPANIKQQLVNVLQELELHKCVWEEKKGEKVEELWRSRDKEQKQSHTQIQEARKAAAVNLWKACSKEGARSRTKDTATDVSETKAKLQRAEQTISDMREQVGLLQASLRSAQAKQKIEVRRVDKGTNTEGGEAHRAVEKEEAKEEAKELRDAAVATDSGVASEQEQSRLQVTAESLLETLKRMEAMVNRALETAKLVRDSEQRVSQVRVRMESITQWVEEALERAAGTNQQLDSLEEKITPKQPTQSPGLPADPGSDVTDFTSNVEPEDEVAPPPAPPSPRPPPPSPPADEVAPPPPPEPPAPPPPAPPADEVAPSPPPAPPEAEVAPPPPPPAPPVIPEVPDPPQLIMNGGTQRGSCSELQEEEEEEEEEEEHHSAKEEIPAGSDPHPEETPAAAETPFIFPHTRSRPPLPPSMPTLPEEEEDSPEDLDTSPASPSTSSPGKSRAVAMTTPTIVYPQQATVVQQDGRPLEQTRPHSPRARLARNSSGGSITTIDSTGNVIDLVKDPLPELQLSEEDRQKNLELLQQAKKVSDRFLTRRGRRSLSESPTASLSPTLSPSSSPCSSRSPSQIMAPQPESMYVGLQSVGQHLEVPSVRDQSDFGTKDQEGNRLLSDWKPPEKRKVSSGTLTPRFAVHKENCDPSVPKSPPAVSKGDEGRIPAPAPATGVAKPVPRPPTQQAPCTAEIKTIGAFPPLMRAVSWDTVGSLNPRNGAPSFPPTAEESFPEKPRDAFKSSGYKDLPGQQGSVQKLSKFREEHKLMRNQSIGGSKLPDLSEAAEQEKGPPLSPNSVSSEEAKEKSDSMPNISDVMLRKLKLHRGLPGCAPPLTEKEVENAFVQLSLAFRNDNYTLEMRLKQAERERNLTEEDTEKELEEFKGALKISSPQWQNVEQREAYQRFIETIAVLHRLATRLSSRSEVVGAVRQEKRMNKATEVMMQYVENLKRTFEKDRAELMEFRKLANQNSNRSYGGSADTGDDGVPRPSRSMSLTMGKALPRRRVSVAVVPKFNLLNIPGQTPATAGPGPNVGPNVGPNIVPNIGPNVGPNVIPNMGPSIGPSVVPSVGPTAGAALPVLCEANDVKGSAATETTQPAAECGKIVSEQESEAAKPPVNLEEIRAELKAKIEEEAYNKGYQEGLKQSKMLQEKQEEELAAEKLLESKNKDEESGKKRRKSRRAEEVLLLLGRFCPKIPLNRRLLWIALTLFVVMCFVISVFTLFSHYYNRRGDT